MSTQASAYRLCREKFVELFKHLYAEIHGDGAIIATRPSKLRIPHQTASPSFGSANMVSVEFNLPDVSTYIGTDDAIRWVGSQCSWSLSSYGRFITAHPDKSRSIEAVSLLPSSIWPDDFSRHVQELKVALESDGGCKVMALRDLFAPLDDRSPMSKKAYTRLGAELESLGMNIEPDARYGGRIPPPDQPIALFAGDHSQSNSSHSDGYAAAALLVHLAGIVAAAGKDFDEAETDVILEHLNTTFELTGNQRARLAARLKIFRVSPPTRYGLKKKVAGLESSVRETICELLIHVSLADGTLAPEKVRTLETLFTLLDVDKSMLYSRLHKAQTASRHIEVPVRDAPDSTQANEFPGRIRLDMERFASLRTESDKIVAVLKAVFEGSSASDEPETPVAEEHQEPSESSLLGLDSEHASLLQVLMQRPQWARAEIEQICLERNLLADGAIEHINDASFSRFDCAIFEGDDPIDLNCELLAKAMV